jgi:hypothetical protein
MVMNDYESMSPMANKFINPDNSIVTLQDIIKGGSGNETLRIYYKHAMGTAGETSFAALSAPSGYYFEHSESEMRKNDGSEAIPVPVVTVSDPSSLNQQTACWWTSDGGDGGTYHVESGVDRSEWTLYLIEEYTKTDVWANAHVV